jgi:hypothetical protein
MPYYRLRIQSPLHPSAVEVRLRQLVKDRGRQFDPPAKSPQFTGEITSRSFRLVRVITYKNSFLPVIRGMFEADPDGGTSIRIRMTIPPFTVVFMVVWLGMVGAGAAAMSLNDLQSGSLTSLFPLGMLLFGLCLPVAGFYPEARKAERLLREAVSGR